MFFWRERIRRLHRCPGNCPFAEKPGFSRGSLHRTSSLSQELRSEGRAYELQWVPEPVNVFAALPSTLGEILNWNTDKYKLILLLLAINPRLVYIAFCRISSHWRERSLVMHDAIMGGDFLVSILGSFQSADHIEPMIQQVSAVPVQAFPGSGTGSNELNRSFHAEQHADFWPLISWSMTCQILSTIVIELIQQKAVSLPPILVDQLSDLLCPPSIDFVTCDVVMGFNSPPQPIVQQHRSSFVYERAIVCILHDFSTWVSYLRDSSGLMMRNVLCSW